MLPAELEDFSLSLVSVSVFSSNILFWFQSGYFEPAAELKPLLHTWSLAIEEQYYLFFPILVVVLWRFRKRILVVSISAVTLSSLVVAQWASMHHPPANFYLLPTRAWELLLGSLCAFFLIYRDDRIPQPLRQYSVGRDCISLLGLIFIIFANLFFRSTHSVPQFLHSNSGFWNLLDNNLCFV